MSRRTKLHLLCFVALPVGLGGLVFLLNLIDPFLPLLAPLYAVPIGVLVERIRCPQCDEPIARRWSTFLGTRWLVRSCFPDRYCVHCGYDLDRKEAKRER